MLGARFESEIREQPDVWRAIAASDKAQTLARAIHERDVVLLGSGSSLCRLAASQSKLQLGYRFPPAFKIALGVRIDSDPDRVPTLIGGHFRVDALLMAETRLGPAQYLKVHPPESDLFELLLNVPPQKIVTRQIRAAFGRKHQCIRTCIRRDVAPIINLAGKIWRQRRLPLAALGLWVVQKTPVNALSDLDHL